MKTEGVTKGPVKAAVQEHENYKSNRKGLRILQHSATDKENLTGRSAVKDAKMAVDQEVKKRKLLHKSVQTEEAAVTEADLTGAEPSDIYWRKLAEKRGEALNESLQEIEHLKDHIENLKEENRICKEMLDESKSLVEVLQEMLEEGEETKEVTTDN
ncbi:uncharacterized protein [Onthophagus taurus]|uniref:uncharacterized protein n=1 Tax=Onthophagus taurus TaxID=166361 RepID=UPI0039BEC2FB